MTIYGRKDLNWKKNQLFFQDELMFTIVPEKGISPMFRVQWPDGIQSRSYYNKTRAKEHCYELALSSINNRGIPQDLNDKETPLGASYARLNVNHDGM